MTFTTNRNSVTKGSLESYTTGGDAHTLTFQFNPTTIQESRSSSYDYSEGQGQVLPLAQFGRIGNTELSFELFFFDNAGVKDKLESLRALTKPKNLSRLQYYNQVQPHRYLLNLHNYGQFTGVVEKVSIKTLRYGKLKLQPVHVVASITFVVTASSLSRNLNQQ